MRNYKITIQYEGTNFSGWQRLPGDKATVQGTLETAIGEVLGYPVTIDGSGRTDAGVHATAQVANVNTSGKLDELDFLEKMNDKLPESLQLIDVELVKNTFHSRYNAKGKRYIYTIDCRDKASVFAKKYAYHYPQELDVERMKKAARVLVGTHDFTSFTDKKDHKTNTRTIHAIEIKQVGDMIEFIYEGNGFLNHMVRIITGTLLDVGTGKTDHKGLKAILDSKLRANAGAMAPSKGLRLEKVYY